MNKLFSEEELKLIFERSLWHKKLEPEGVKLPDYKTFENQMDCFCNAFPMTISNSPFFGEVTEYVASYCDAWPFAEFVRKEIDKSCKSDYILSGAFSEWPDAFMESVASIFGLIANSELEKSVGEMTRPTSDWVVQKALPYCLSGKQFKNMAHKYPIYARQMIGVTFLYIEHIKEIIDAINDELPGLYSHFFEDGNMPRISRVSASSSDRHNGGRNVHFIEFENGKRLVYKPRSLAIDRAFNKWLGFCAQKACMEPFYQLKAFDTKRGGFCEFAKAWDVCSEEELPYFFEKMGFLLGAVYLLRGNDMHSENIIARGKEPVIIDLETLLAPKGCLLERLLTSERRYAVNDMAIIPFMGLGPGMQEVRFASLCYCMTGSNNLPKLKGETVSGEGYSKEIADGFKKALLVVKNNRREAEEAIKEAFTDVEIRMVLKATSFYCRILMALGNKYCQEDGDIYYSIAERSKSHSNKIDAALLDFVLHQEVMAYDRLDIPYFTDVVNKDMVQNLIDKWDELDNKVIENECAKIRCGLVHHAADDQSQQVVLSDSLFFEKISAKDVEDNLASIADELLEVLAKHRSVMLMPRDQDKYIILSEIGKMASYLDGGLGAVVALLAYCNAFAVDDSRKARIKRQVQEMIDKYKKDGVAAPSLSASAMGLADGTAGFILGSLLCYRLGGMSEEDVKELLEKVGAISRDSQKIKYTIKDYVYGSCDMLLALSQIPDRFMTGELRSLHDQILDSLSDLKQFQNMDEEEIISKCKAELIHRNAEENRIYGNHSLRFGNAGTLYSYALKKSELAKDERIFADRLAKYLGTRRHVLEGIEYPDDCIECGMLHGMAGVLYSVSKYCHPDKVPSLYIDKRGI